MLERKTSLTDPINIAWITRRTVGRRGRIGLTFCPGKVDFKWERNLDLDLARLKRHHRIDVLACLLEDHEFTLLKVPNLLQRAKAHGLRVLHFAVPDGGTPTDDQAFRRLVSRILRDIRAGRNVGIHCRGGLGRAGTLGSCTLMALLGCEPSAAIHSVRRQRPGAVENLEQERFVEGFRWKRFA
jgi:ADP-ribosyl-[dinitrogen reductase] hydrolase